uniref:Uncharacterized protein n=1 Tax=Rhizophora mucronata TaxID=61149 RepID=A0A2P2IRZ3_RHIMU
MKMGKLNRLEVTESSATFQSSREKEGNKHCKFKLKYLLMFLEMLLFATFRDFSLKGCPASMKREYGQKDKRDVDNRRHLVSFRDQFHAAQLF